MKKFTFDVECVVNAEIEAETEKEARVALRAVLNTLDVDENTISGINSEHDKATVKTVSISIDDDGADVLEEEADDDEFSEEDDDL